MPDQGNSSNLFAADPAAVAPTVAAVTTDSAPAFEHNLVGVGKKYADIPTALSALEASQTHIGTIESENAQLKAAALAGEQRSSQEELAVVKRTLESMNARLSEVANADPHTAVSEEQVALTVAQVIANNEVTSKRIANQTAVSSAFISKYGDQTSAKTAYEAAALANGMTPAAFDALAGQAPAAVAKLCGLSLSGTAPTLINTGSVNSAAVANQPDAPQVKGIMVGASSADVRAQWSLAGSMAQSKE